MDLDLDAYADDSDDAESSATQPVQPQVEEQKRVSILEAAERAGIPLEELLPKLEP